MVTVETVYRARLDFDVDGTSHDSIDKLDAIGRYAVKLGDQYGVEVSDNAGGSCWNAYVVLEGADRDLVQRVANRIVAYVKKFKGGVVLD